MAVYEEFDLDEGIEYFRELSKNNYYKYLRYREWSRMASLRSLNNEKKKEEEKEYLSKSYQYRDYSAKSRQVMKWLEELKEYQVNSKEKES